ncbi:MaoC family dehydratase [Paraburkholderia aspalathi]|jgi:acyl dehydratase|uniref:Acyl dehydratase n=1 Tax=Paraburkholderia aspalathi TaxID=1324617 RepID=A0A1I7DC03_9BURK|nr:MaoC family dehydratase N-terminal domain-containing protein [Paraburkholderia aspalathi]SFU09221.1 Acyl dehydratase [Paraburkholderia aspalathi]
MKTDDITHDASKKAAPRMIRSGEDSPSLTDDQIEDARKLIGVWLRRDVHTPAIYEPLSVHDIRRWARYSVGDDNPLFSESDYAKRSTWGTVVAPPTFLYTIDSGIVAPGLPGIQWIFAGSRFEHFLPVKAGDTITARARLIDVQIKEGSNIARYVNQVGEVLYTNQHNQLVTRYEGDIYRVPRKRSGGGFKFAVDDKKELPPPYRYTDDEIEAIANGYRNEYRRGNDTLYWEDVQIGDQLPTVLKGPLTLVDIVGFYSGRRTVYNVMKLAFADRDRHPRNVYYSPARNVPMHPAAGHFDVEIAHEIGMPGAYDQGWQRISWAGHLLTNWCGDRGFVRRLDGRVTKPNLVGDLTRLTGEITGKRKTSSVEGGEALIDVSWWGENQRGERNCRGEATVRLPSRDITLTC